MNHGNAHAGIGMSRRQWLAGSAAAVWPCRAAASSGASTGVLTRPIPASGEALPVVGLGSWITFNVGNDPKRRAMPAAEVVRAFFAAGGRLIDSSPMYGSSQPTIGHALRRLGRPAALFSAEKVWIGDARGGADRGLRGFWGVPRFDLMQVHNLLAWEEHLPTPAGDEGGRAAALRRHHHVAKGGGTPSRGASCATQPLDFVQVSYNLVDREVEQRILPLARERGIAVIVNRPFREGRAAAGARATPAARAGPPRSAATAGRRSR
jgi:diketogulonate reductase-like aldo/keto reductase